MSVLNSAIKTRRTARTTGGSPALIDRLRKAAARSGKFLAHLAAAFAEVRMQRAQLEVELYRRRYRHISKNDDDLPVIH